MTQSGYGIGDEPLTPVELQRLRPSVNPTSLEHWLRLSHGELRRAFVAHFANEVTNEDELEIGRELGATEHWRPVVSILPPDDPSLRAAWDDIEPLDRRD